MSERVRWGKLVRVVGLLGCVLGLGGCGKFFQPSSTGTGSGSGSGSGSGGSTTLNQVYIANANPNLDTIAAFSLASGTLSGVTGTTTQLAVTPTSLAINPAGTLLWVGSDFGAIYVTVVNSDGTLTLGANSTPVAQVAAGAMVVDPTGQWLLVEETQTGGAPVLYAYQIDATNGTLTPSASSPIALDTGSATALQFAPNGTELFAALGTGGVDVLTFSPVTGALNKVSLLAPKGNAYADQGLAVDPTGTYLFVGETGINGVRVLTINADGSLTEVTGSPYPTGAGAKSVLVDSTGSYVYVANSATNTVSAFSLGTGGALTQLAGSPFTTGSSPYGLAEDNTGKYLLVACLGGSPDLQQFAIGSGTGVLSSVATASTGTSGVVSAATAVVTTP